MSDSLVGKRIVIALQKQWRLFLAVFAIWCLLLVALGLCEYYRGTTEVQVYVPVECIGEMTSAPVPESRMGENCSAALRQGRLVRNDGSLFYAFVEVKPWRQVIGTVDGMSMWSFAGDCIYLMAISFTTVGFGDIVPSLPVTRAICVVSGMLGMFVFGVIAAIVYEKARY